MGSKIKKYEENEEKNTEEQKSRSAKKRECLALQKLGEELIKLSSEKRKTLKLPEELDEALQMYDSLSDKEAKRRQRQYVGRLMREVDTLAIQEAIKKAQG